MPIGHGSLQLASDRLSRSLRLGTLPSFACFHILLPTALGSIPFQGIHRYYGGSDFPRRLSHRGFSQLHVLNLPSIPSSTTIVPRPSLLHATPQRGRLLLAEGWASPLSSRLTKTSGRIRFVILRTARSPPVALHPASRRRSYFQFQAGERMPETDFHRPD